MTTDIVALQREYAHLRQKRKNMHVIFNGKLSHIVWEIK